METNDPLTNLLKNIHGNDKVNHLYLLIDGSASVNHQQFNLMKKTCRFLLSNFKFSDTQPYPTRATVIQFSSNFTVHATAEPSITKLTNALEGMVQLGSGTNLEGALQHCQRNLKRDQGNQTVFIFTDGDINAEKTIESMLMDEYHIICFLILENGGADVDKISKILGLSRLIVFQTFLEMEAFFDKLFLANVEAPQLFVKNCCTTEIILDIKSSIKYTKFEVYGYIEGAKTSSLLGTTKLNQITLKGLQPDKKYHLMVREKLELNPVSKFSKEVVVWTLKKHPLSDVLMNSSLREKEVNNLREKYQNYKIHPVLKEAGLKYINLCMFGEMGNGKSSVINTIISALSDGSQEPQQIAETGLSNQSYTKKLSKYSIFGTVPIKIWDIWGWQISRPYRELDALIAGKLRENFKEDSTLDTENPYYSTEIDINNIPHAFITICDIYSIFNPEKSSRFRKFYNWFKQEAEYTALVAMTKFDLLINDDGENVRKDELQKIYDYGSISETIEEFAKASQLSPLDVFPMVNYQRYEPRSSVKDFIALKLLDKAITSTETYFKKHKILKIVDQTNTRQTSIFIPTLNLDLESFSVMYFRKITNDNFHPEDFYNSNGCLVKLDEYQKTFVEGIAFDKKSENGYISYTIKIHNKKPKINFIVSYDPSLNQPEKTIKFAGTLKKLRRKLGLHDNYKFSKKSIQQEGFFQPNEEEQTSISTVLDRQSKIYIISQQPSTDGQRILFKCEACGTSVPIIIKTKTADKIREELISKNIEHFGRELIFKYSDNYDVHKADENEVTLQEMIVNDDGKKHIYLICSKCSKKVF